MPSRPEGVISPAVVKENGSLAFPDDHLGAPFDLSRTLLGNPVDQLLSRFVEPLDDFQKNDVVCAHGSPS